MEEIKKIYVDQIEKVFDVRLIQGGLTEKEKTYYKEMASEYTSDEFLMERSERKIVSIPSDVVRKIGHFKVPEGPLIRIVLLIKDKRIWDILISGTIHASPLKPTSPIYEIERVLKSQPIDETIFESKIVEILNRPYFNVAKVSPSWLANRIYECATLPSQ